MKTSSPLDSTCLGNPTRSVSVCVCACVSVHTTVCVRVLCVCMYMCMCICMCICLCMFVCVCVCMRWQRDITPYRAHAHRRYESCPRARLSDFFSCYTGRNVNECILNRVRVRVRVKVKF